MTGAEGLPRGLRLKNPLNIRLTPTLWRGEVPGEDPEFKTFATMQDGVCEAGRLLLAYIPKLEAAGKPVCVATIIARWAPAGDGNDVYAYAKDVAGRLGVSLSQKLNLRDPATLRDLIAAMAHHECGLVADRVITSEILSAGVTAALA